LAVERLPPGVGAAPERPPQGPVASLGVGLERLRQLGWERGSGHEELFKSSLTYLAVVPAIFLVIGAIIIVFASEIGFLLYTCLGVGTLLVIYSIANAYQTWAMKKRMEGMLHKRVAALGDRRLEGIAGAAMAAAGFPHARMTPLNALGVRERFLLNRHAVYRLQDLGAYLMVSIIHDPDGKNEGITLHMGPVTADNVGGLVRLAEELEHHIASGRT